MARDFSLKTLVTSVSWLTLMLGKTTTTERILYYTGRIQKLVKHTKVLHKWTGWNKNKTVVLQSHRYNSSMGWPPCKHYRYSRTRRLHC